MCWQIQGAMLNNFREAWGTLILAFVIFGITNGRNKAVKLPKFELEGSVDFRKLRMTVPCLLVTGCSSLMLR